MWHKLLKRMMTTENNPRVSVVSPTYQEVENIPLLAARVNAALANDSYELLIVDDDSGDGTAAVCAQLAKTMKLWLQKRKRKDTITFMN